MNKELFVSAVFSYADEMLTALKTLKENSFINLTAYTPVPVHDVEHILDTEPSKVKYFTLTGAILGFVSGFALAILSSLQWNFVTGGKPAISIWPFIVVGFEVTILFGAIFTLVGLLHNARIPRIKIAKGYNEKFSNDKFGIVVKSDESKKDEIIKLLNSNGAEEVNIEY